ncbi:MAG: Peptidase S24-like [Acidobacteriota bacterium]|jgi:SOS-response transcriptional repressor LexA|nr:Peptidase S24-like [Acidobacteriota bacterium]
MQRQGGRKDNSVQARALAKAVHAAVQAYNRRSPLEPFAIDDATSRILENDPDYHPPRRRMENKKRPPTENPGIFTVQAIAERLGTTIPELLRQRLDEVTSSDLRTFRWIADYLQLRFDLESVGAMSLPDPHSFREKEFTLPQPLTSTPIELKGELAAGVPRESEIEGIASHVVGAVKTATLFAATVRGRSMQDRMRDGDTIVFDSAQRPKQHEPVAIYIHNEGGVIGYWRAEAGTYYLDKHNYRDYPPIKLPDPADWHVLGVITLIQSRASRQDRPTPAA